MIKILGKSEQGVKGNLSMLYIVMQDNYLSLDKNWNVEQTQWYTLEVFNDKQLNKWKTIKLEIKKTVFGYMNEEYVAIYMVLSKSNGH